MRYVLLLSLAASCMAADWGDAVWHNCNPGAGGNIQAIDLDPNTPGRMFFSSDMEGAYRSDDWGQSWHHISDNMHDTYVQRIAVTPGDAKHVYAGTLSTLEVSTDGGHDWRRVPEVNDSIGDIAVCPTQPNIVIAVPGQRYRCADDDDVGRRTYKGQVVRGAFGTRDIYRSADGGASWTTISLLPGQGRRDGFSLDWHPTDVNTVLVGTLDGIFLSTDAGLTWKAIASPNDIGDGFGATFGADGTTIYASYRLNSSGVGKTMHHHGVGSNGKSNIFAKKITAATWTNISAGQPGFAYSQQFNDTMYWRPRVHPQGTATGDTLLVGTYRPQHGLWSVEVDWSKAKPAATWKRILWYDFDAKREDMAWDRGWESWGIMAEDYHFTPASWKTDKIVTSGGQTAYMTDRSDPAYANKWQPIYTEKTSTVQGVAMYRTRGAQCTFNFGSIGNSLTGYVIQSQGDNCVQESFDGGWSWTNALKPPPRITSRSNSCTIMRGLKYPIVLAHIAVGWGASASTGQLWAKVLTTESPSDTWVHIGAGEERLAGIGNFQINQLVQDPHNPKCVYIATFGRGVYVIDDIEATVAAATAGRPIPKASSPTLRANPPKPKYIVYTAEGLTADPNTANVIYVAEQKVLYKGQADSTAPGGWTWTTISPTNFVSDFSAWNNNGTTWIAAVIADSSHQRVVASTDQGATWFDLIQFADFASVRSPPWFSSDMSMQIGGIVGYKNSLIFISQTDILAGRLVYGVFQAHLKNNKIRSFTDITADNPWAYAVQSRIVEHQGKPWLYLSTRGAGLWRRAVPQ